MQSYGRLLIVVVLSALSGWFLFHQTLEKKTAPVVSAGVEKAGNSLYNIRFPDVQGHPQALKQWQGKVERRPTAIQTLGTRQVGEVVCEIENPGRDLIPGTNVNAELRTAVAPGALVLPKESLRRDAQGVFVFVLKDGAIERRLVKTGVSSISLVQAVEGLSEGDAVAMPSDVALQPGLRVTPSYQ